VYVFFLSPSTIARSIPAVGWHNRSPGGHPYAVVFPGCWSIASNAGSSVEVPLTGWSTALVGDWPLQVSVSGAAAHALTATLDPNATDLINNGETVQLRVTTDGSALPGSTAIVQVDSTAYSAATEHIHGVRAIPVTITTQ
jgi:hypothetical protein